MTMESCFTCHTQFVTINKLRIQFYILGGWSHMSTTNYDFFIKFVENLKFYDFLEVVVKKIPKLLEKLWCFYHQCKWQWLTIQQMKMINLPKFRFFLAIQCSNTLWTCNSNTTHKF